MKLTPERTPLNIVPFIDIMLVLLCIVLSVSSFIAQGKIEVKLPSSSSQAKPEQQVALLLEANAQGELYLDGTQISPHELKARLANLTHEQHVQLRLDEQCDFAIFIAIIDTLKALKHENFSIATQQS